MGNVFGSRATMCWDREPVPPELKAVDEKVERVHSNKGKWAALPLKEKLLLLAEMFNILRTKIDAEQWALDEMKAASIPETVEMAKAMSMIINMKVMSSDIEVLLDTLATVEATGAAPKVPVKPLANGQMVASVYPRPWAPGDKGGPQGDWKAEMYMMPGSEATQGKFYGKGAHKGKCALILAAGNQGFLGLCDALYSLFVDGEVCIVKHHPVREYNNKWTELLFEPLIREGYFASVVGGVDVSAFLCKHVLVEHVHMTGGKPTHDAIVWGPTEGREERMKKNTPVLKKPMTSELGAVTPWMIVPGTEPWTQEQILHHAKYLAVCFMNNNSCNCNAPKCLVLGKDWPQRHQFLATLKGVLKKMPHPAPYYPGTQDRYAAFLEQYPDAEQVKSEIPGPPSFGPLGAPVPWTFIEVPYEKGNVPLDSAEHPYALHTEAFAPVMAVVPDVPGTSEEFMKNAVGFVNNSLFGTLSCVFVVDEKTQEAYPEAYQNAVNDLKYGTVGVNAWGGSCFMLPTASWGAFPGEKLDAVASGIGSVRNYLLFDNVEKTVVKAPFQSLGHIGTDPEPMTLDKAKGLVKLVTGNIDTARHNATNPYRTIKNFCPIEGEGLLEEPKVTGEIPKNLEGMYVRNGTNQRFDPYGKVHMFDGDAMLHCVKFSGGKAVFYANTWLQTKRFNFNTVAGKELFPSFGDVMHGGIEVARKLGLSSLMMRSGETPMLPENDRPSPATSTCYIGGKMYACVEVGPPHRVHINPDTGKVVSAPHADDFKGKIHCFSAHYKICPSSGELIYIGRPPSVASPPPAPGKAPMCTYGVLNKDGTIKSQREFPVGYPEPCFLHDYFLTPKYCVIVDHSLRACGPMLPVSGLYQWNEKFNLRFGIIDRANPEKDIQWIDTGRLGFVWHVAAGWEDGDNLVLYMPVFDEYTKDVPIHLPSEPDSFLNKFVVNLKTGKVVEHKVFMNEKEGGHVVERLGYNPKFFGSKDQRYVYLMKRAEGKEMYEGFVKFDLKDEKPVAVVSYGSEDAPRRGGECFFVEDPTGKEEEDGWLIDIVYDEKADTSEVCIWDARTLAPGKTDPVAKVELNRRVPYGVHANFLTHEELALQWQGVPAA
eukprot:TRINITY_DN9920_c0_g1_i1.p1 TRINITY_DN9920_c0_g1~~TRINITY_DN9920_c0_g1_i1.p1  ORF type:complete len:1103 (-),score=269.46 TRINITY_DN9920_c0_g1_i1:280-3588(-)